MFRGAEFQLVAPVARRGGRATRTSRRNRAVCSRQRSSGQIASTSWNTGRSGQSRARRMIQARFAFDQFFSASDLDAGGCTTFGIGCSACTVAGALRRSSVTPAVAARAMSGMPLAICGDGATEAARFSVDDVRIGETHGETIARLTRCAIAFIGRKTSTISTARISGHSFVMLCGRHARTRSCDEFV
jgi:hypothetical protein